MTKILVVGSSNTDMVVKTPRFPEPGETILGGDFFMFPGGKGANQAVAAARMGGDVSFICCVGDDIFGQNALKGYKKEGINVEGCLKAEGTPSGVALITVNKEGENEIVVASGANNLLSESHILEHKELLNSAEVLLTQLETPMEVVSQLANICKNSGQRFIVNPAPAQPLSDAILDGLFLITPNETESKLLTGIEVNDEESAAMACEGFFDKGVQNVIITMGSRGAFFMNKTQKMLIKPPKVTAVDTTAAGDVFNGTLAVFLAEGQGWKESIEQANKAAAVSVTKMGAQASAPFKSEIN
ncbi:ribokinase [Muriicola sp. Z0-33]|uniref:ribokinase n=1 Tax=Muriicola sp. Z0-33 TaxID=2816957 RepID=UPI002238586B|nr:ribokinase [Muriicola sp. Z0-33]MCW5517789.1 ribokinase [Muriicola sp. Z0-33]